jgi:hypothetical protein
MVVKEVQNSIIHVAFAYPEFVNSTPKQIGPGPPQVAPKWYETFECGNALLVSRRILPAEFA